MSTASKTADHNLVSQRIEIRFPYDLEEIKFMRSLPDRRWESEITAWTLPATPFHANLLLKYLPKRGYKLDPRLYSLASPATTKPKFVAKRDGLFPFQSEAVEFMHRHGGRVLVGDEMGLGKTVEVCQYIKELNEKSQLQRVIVVTTASTVYKWGEEIDKWAGMRYQIVRSSKDYLSVTTPIWIMSSAVMSRIVPDLATETMRIDVLVADECHQYGNPKTQRTKALKELSLYADRFLPMSGTPFMNRPIELFPILQMLRPTIYRDWYAYAMRYCDGHRNAFGLDVSGASNTAELKERLADLMIRRVKQDVLTQLPSLRRTSLHMDVPNEEINNAIASLQMRIAQQGIRTTVSNHLVELSTLRRALGMAKADAAVDEAVEFLSQTTRKLVLYAHHKDVVQALVAGLKAKGYDALVIVGDVPTQERQPIVTQFQNDKARRVMVISSAGGEGINLYAADRIIFVEREWNPAKEEQAEARLHRIGQVNPVEAIYLVAHDTVDERIDRLIESKRDAFSQVMGANDIERTVVLELLKSLQ